MDDLDVGDGFEPHPSHKMTEWKSTIVTLIATPRFGQIRHCEYCEAEEAKAVSGHKAHGKLTEPCCEVPQRRRRPNLLAEPGRRFLIFESGMEPYGGVSDVADLADTEDEAKRKAAALWKHHHEDDVIVQSDYDVYVFDCDKRAVVFNPGKDS